MRRIAPARVHRAVIALHEWWLSAQPQGAKHILPLLALLERGAGTGATIHFEERPDEYDFWDRYMRVPGDQAMPYMTPLTRERVEADYPHSNAATMRKNRFWRAWNAARLESGAGREALWTLEPDYAAIFRDKGLKKAGVVHRVPVVDLAAFLLRRDSFPDDATASTLVERFRERFKQGNADYDTLFIFVDEDPAELFTSEPVDDSEYDEVIRETIIEEVPAPMSATDIPDPTTTECLDEDDAVFTQVRELLALGSSGFILRGIPGTSKTWYARRIAERLVHDADKHIFRVQFHPSYGYEDFVEGYRPEELSKAGFQVIPKTFLLACEVAEQTTGYVVVIVDEINRGDPSRIFGDLLTYLERDYRGEEFYLPYSGDAAVVPANVVLLGTMNPYDRSIAQLDQAFIRRFDHIDLLPSSEMVGTFLESSGAFSSAQITRVQQWFETVQRLVPIGHTYFKDVTKLEHLQLVWKYRIWPACEAALEFDDRKRADVKAAFEAMYASVLGQQHVMDDTQGEA